MITEKTHEPAVVWLAGWYATRLHAVLCHDQSKLPMGRRSYIESECGQIVYAIHTDWAQRRIGRGIPRCKHCERIISKLEKK